MEGGARENCGTGFFYMLYVLLVTQQKNWRAMQGNHVILYSLSVPDMTYNVFSGTLNPTQSVNLYIGMYCFSNNEDLHFTSVIYFLFQETNLWMSLDWFFFTKLPHNAICSKIDYVLWGIYTCC